MSRTIDINYGSSNNILLTGAWIFHKGLNFYNLVIGSTFKLGKYQVESEDPWPIEWEIVHQTDTYQIAMTKQIIDLRPFDAKEPTNPDNNRKNRGNNNWQYSNIEQWLNSDQANWYSAQHQYDAPPSKDNVWQNVGIGYNPYDTHKGFLYYWSNEDKALLKDMTLTLANNTVTDGGGSYTWTGKVWLPTYTQMGFGKNNSINEGTKFSKFTDNSSRIKTINKYCAENNKYCKKYNIIEGREQFYWMSSVISNSSCSLRLVSLEGSDTSGGDGVYDGTRGIAPCICLPRTNDGGVIKTITFYIENVEYKSPANYTFSQWVNTSYNNNFYYYNNGTNIVHHYTNKGIKDINVNDIIENGKNYTLGDIPSVGSTFKLGKYQVESETPWDIEWEVVDKRDGYVIAMTKQIIDCRCFDGKESTNTDNNRKQYGNNNWQYSNIEQFLNSDQASWYSAQHSYDAPPNKDNCYPYPNGTTYNAYDTHKGFLYHWSNKDKALLKDMTLTLANNTVTDGGGSYTWTGKVFLPTYTQMGYGNNNNIAEGTQFSKFSNNSNRIKSLHPNCIANNEFCKVNNKGGNWLYWMSSVDPSYSSRARLVLNDGSAGSNTAYGSEVGLAPCICLPDTILI